MAAEAPAPQRLALVLSEAAAAVSAAAGAATFLFWRVFERDHPMWVGNARGTGATVAALAVPTLLLAMRAATRGSERARFVWLGALVYLAYNAVMFCFALSFNRFFLLYTTMLALCFWALVTLAPTVGPWDARTTERVPVRAVAVYLALTVLAFGALWLREIAPAMLANAVPPGLAQAALAQNPVWVLDFAFTFPLCGVGAVLLLRRARWGFVLAGGMTIGLTLETAGIAADQWMGHRHDPTAPLAAVPVMLVLTVVGLLFSLLFLRGVRDP